MADRREPDVLGSADLLERAPRVVVSRGASVIASALAVHLLVATAVVEDRRSATPPRERADAVDPSPSPVPSRSPEVITPEQGAARRQTALETARFTAGQVCKDTSDFLYAVVDSTSDAIETFVDARDRTGVTGIVVKVTLLPGGVAYTVVEERGDCDG